VIRRLLVLSQTGRGVLPGGDWSDAHGLFWKVECMEFISRLAATSEPLVCGGSFVRHRRHMSAFCCQLCRRVCEVQKELCCVS
jgi:hypothetical protein